MCVPKVVIGRCMRAQKPPILRGNKAASLSSGGMMTPRRSKLRKSFVNARETPGPPRAKEVYAMVYCSSSGTYVILGSSMPQISSGYSRGLAIRVGSSSMRQPSIPLTERAAHRCDRPLLSSTRQSNRTSPSGSLTAPALKTLLMGYGQSLRLRMGLPE